MEGKRRREEKRRRQKAGGKKGEAKNAVSHRQPGGTPHGGNEHNVCAKN